MGGTNAYVAILFSLALLFSSSFGFVPRGGPRARTRRESPSWSSLVLREGRETTMLPATGTNRGNEEKTERSEQETPDHHPQKEATTRRQVFTKSASFVAALALVTAPNSAPAGAMNMKSRVEGYEVQQTEQEWKGRLRPMQYDVLRNGATEAPYSSILEGEKRSGVFVCAACQNPLFDSQEKFQSGTGWPSFARALPTNVETENMNALASTVVGAELRCQNCGGHLGDVFNDGILFVGTPAFTSGKRYCIDGAALVFQPRNGEENLSGDRAPPPKPTPSWLEPPKIRVS